MSHNCRYLLMHCMDFRFGSELKKFMQEKGMMDDADLVSIAGAAQNIVNPETRDFALRQIEISKTLHGMAEVNLMNHTDCGAYGGRGAFENAEVERNKLIGDLKEARDIVKTRWPELQIKLWLAHIEAGEHENKIRFEEIV